MSKLAHALQSDVGRLEYAYGGRCGDIYLFGSPCDMSGCIKLFEAIDADVAMIRTWLDHEPDTVYMKEKTGWVAFDPAPRIMGRPRGPHVRRGQAS